MSWKSWFGSTTVKRDSYRELFQERRDGRRPGGSGPRRMKFEPLEQRHLLTAGALDPTFGDGGIVTTDIGYSGDDNAFDVATLSQGDGKLLVAGETDRGMTVVRYNADGTLDGTFGDAGIGAVDVGTSGELTRGLALQADGKIVVAGTCFDSTGRDFAVARLNADGTVDTGFGGAGSVTTDFGSATEEAYDVAILSERNGLRSGHCALQSRR